MDFTGDLVDIDLSSNGKIKAPSNGRIALIDADTVVFGSVLSHQETIELLSRGFYNNQEWSELTSMGSFDPDALTVSKVNEATCYESIMEKLQGILDATGCYDWELHFTMGRNSFRYTQVKEDYKANRLDMPTPHGIKEMKKLLKENFPDKVFLHTEFEADDAVVAKKKAEPEKYTLCAVDKDILYSLPTTPDNLHFNYYSRAEGQTKTGVHLSQIDMTFFEVSEEKALKHHYIQTLTGDTGDNVIGLTRVGPKTAEKALDGCTTHKQCWEAVVSLYNSKGRDIIDAVLNMRLVNMHQVAYNPETKEFTLTLWRPEDE